MESKLKAYIQARQYGQGTKQSKKQDYYRKDSQRGKQAEQKRRN